MSAIDKREMGASSEREMRTPHALRFARFASLASLRFAHTHSLRSLRSHALASQEKFKPGVRSMIFIFCDQKGNKVFEFPWFEEYKPVLDPIVNHILDLYGLDLSYVNRLQLALMTPYAEIKQHVDKGDWVAMSHRIHVVVTVNPEVKFNVWADDDWGEVRIAKGDVWEINNLFRHKVSNEGPNERIHLIMDLGEVPHTGEDWIKLEKGDACDYKESLRSGRLACVSSLEEGWEQRL
jgi:hypothetical protein